MTNKASTEDRPELKNAIVVAAVQLFIEQGYEKTTIRDIAARAGVGRGHLYYYFKKKEEILLYNFKELIKQIYYYRPFETASFSGFITEYTLRKQIYYTVLREVPGLFRIFQEGARNAFLRKEYANILKGLFLEKANGFADSLDADGVHMGCIIETASEFELLEYAFNPQKIVESVVFIRFSLLGIPKEEITKAVKKTEALYKEPETRAFISALIVSIKKQFDDILAVKL